MADAAPPRKSGPGRWILMGCGCLGVLMLLGMAGFGGVFYFAYQSTMPVATEGLQYLGCDQVRNAFGPKYSIHRNALGWNVHTAGDRGDARIEYTVRDGDQAEAGEATVWLVKVAGKWRGVGARVVPKKGEAFAIGSPRDKEGHRIDWD